MSGNYDPQREQEREMMRLRAREREREIMRARAREERDRQKYYTSTANYNSSPAPVVSSDDETTDDEILPPAPVEPEPKIVAVVEEQRRIAVRNKQILHYGLGLIAVLALLVVFIGAWRLIKKSRRAKKALAHGPEFRAPPNYASEKTIISPMTGPIPKEKDATPAYGAGGSGAASHAQATPMVYGNFGHATKG